MDAIFAERRFLLSFVVTVVGAVATTFALRSVKIARRA
jgi:hypothetical protein